MASLVAMTMATEAKGDAQTTPWCRLGVISARDTLSTVDTNVVCIKPVLSLRKLRVDLFYSLWLWSVTFINVF